MMTLNPKSDLKSLRLGDDLTVTCNYKKQPHESHPLVKLLMSDMIRLNY